MMVTSTFVREIETRSATRIRKSRRSLVPADFPARPDSAQRMNLAPSTSEQYREIIRNRSFSDSSIERNSYIFTTLFDNYDSFIYADSLGIHRGIVVIRVSVASFSANDRDLIRLIRGIIRLSAEFRG